MATVTNKTRKQVTLTNDIMVDNVIVKGQQATISSDGQTISLSDWTNDMDLYKANRAAIREKEAEFEDLAFTEQEEMISLLAE